MAQHESQPVAPAHNGFRRFMMSVVVLAALGGAGWVTVQKAEAAKEATAEKTARKAGPVAVRVSTVEKGDSDTVLAALGTVTSPQTVTVKTQIAGKIVDVGFREGQDVKKGDFLAQIDARPYENALNQAQGQLEKDRALLKEAELNLARYQKLVAQDSLAKQQLDTQESLTQQYKGTVQSDEAQVETAKLNLSYCRIVSPIDGRAGLRLTDPGNYVQASDSTGIVTLAQMNPISVLFTVPEDVVPQVSARMRDPTSIAVEAFDRAQSRKLASGTLAAVNNQIDSTTGTLKMRALFANDEGALFPNQFVNVRLVLQTTKDATLVDSAAVQRGSVGTFVYLVQGDKVAARPVKIETDDGKKAVVAEGLAVGDQVVIDGIDKLHDGAEIATGAKSGERKKE